MYRGAEVHILGVVIILDSTNKLDYLSARRISKVLRLYRKWCIAACIL